MNFDNLSASNNHSTSHRNTSVDNFWNRVIEITLNITSMYCDFNKREEDFLLMLVKKSCRLGVPQSYLKSRVCDLYSVDEIEMDYLIDLYYKKEEFEKDFFLLKTIILDKPTLQTAPEFPQEIYKLLPKILLKSVEVISGTRQRDMFLLSALSVLSGCINNVTGLYAGVRVYPNIYSFVIAPAANGKSVTQFAKRLGQKYHKSLMDEWKEAVEIFKSANQGQGALEQPEPVKKLLYLPANSSSAAFLEKLKASGGKAVMFETEADTISNTLKNDWGGYSELMRAAFHHETISVNRKGNNGLIEIDNPRLAISISGTPAQVGALLKSQENGLFSRFAFYGFADLAQWKDVSPTVTTADKVEYFEGLSEDVLNMVRFCESFPAMFNYTGQQWEKFNEHFRWLVDYFGLTGNNSDFLAVLTRHGLIRFRISMILGALRRFDNVETGEKYECEEDDYRIAEQIAEVLLAHSVIAMDLVPKSFDPSLGNSEQRFFNALPKKFDRTEAVKIGEQINLKARSCDRYLKILADKCKLERVANGVYLKH